MDSARAGKREQSHHRPGGLCVPLALGERIQIIRRVRGLTELDAGQRVGIDRAYLVRIEAGLHNPSAVTLLHLARSLAVPVPLLVDDRTTPLRVLQLLGNLTDPNT